MLFFLDLMEEKQSFNEKTHGFDGKWWNLMKKQFVLMEKPLGFPTETTVIHCLEYVEGKNSFLDGNPLVLHGKPMLLMILGWETLMLAGGLGLDLKQNHSKTRNEP